MKTMEENPGTALGKSWIVRFLANFKDRFLQLFQPEEVEVTFDEEGDKTKYTYTVVHHNHAA